MSKKMRIFWILALFGYTYPLKETVCTVQLF